uniref:Neutral amino acid transporter 9 n=1 Tax=Ciona savignyi TaxID=51511 RepID=H2YWF1_CIOSA
MEEISETTALIKERNDENNERTDSTASDQGQSSVVTIFSIWNMMMGSSLLSVPWAFQQAGLAQSLIVHFLMATIAVYTAYIILKCADKLSGPGSKQMPELIDMCVTL